MKKTRYRVLVAVIAMMPAVLALPDRVAGQECSWAASAGLSIPANRHMRIDGINARLSTGWSGRLGHACELGAGSGRLGMDADVQRVYDFRGMYLISLMGRLGLVYRADTDSRTPWFEIAGNAGFVYAFDPVDYVEILIPRRRERTPGRAVDLPGLGPTAGGSARVGFPTSPSGSFLLDVGIRVILLPTKDLNGLLEDESGVLMTLPITVGYQLSL